MNKIIRQIISILFPELTKEQIEELVIIINYVIYRHRSFIEYTCLEIQDMCTPIYSSLAAMKEVHVESFVEFKKLLKMILINKFIDFLRKHNRLKDRVMIEGTKKNIYFQKDNQLLKIDRYQFENYRNELLINEVREFLKFYILKLNNKSRKLVLLMFMDGYNCREISIKLNKPYKEVKKIIEVFKQNARKYFL